MLGLLGEIEARCQGAAVSTYLLSRLLTGKLHERKCRKHDSPSTFFFFFNFVSQRVANKNPSTPLACPECRQQTNTFDIESFPKNVFLIRLLDQIKQKEPIEISTPTATTKSSEATTKTKANDQEKTQSTVTVKAPSESQPQPSPVPYAKALYDFSMNPLDDEGCLKFQKGMIIQVTRRVDQNWAEGKIGEAVGIFPLSFVNMNQAATALMQSYSTKWRLPASMPTVDPSSPQRHFQQQPPLQPTPAQSLTIRPTSPPSSSQTLNQSSSHSPPSLTVSPDKTGLYIALHNYAPLKADELELKKGSQYIVREACQDGWFKGSCSDNLFKKGVFPGNYVMPMLYHQKMVAMQRNAALQAQKNPLNTNTQQMRSTGAYTNLGLSSIPPELPQRNPSNRSTQSPLSQHNKSSEASSENSQNAQTQKTEDIVNKLKRESVTEMLMKKLGYNRKSTESSAYSMDNPVFEDSSSATATTPKTPLNGKAGYNHMRSGSCPIDLGLTNANIENMQFGSQRVKIRERSALPM